MMRRLLAPLLFGLAGCAILLSLGFWQTGRMAWKQEILAGIDARIGAAPVALPAAPDAVADLYLPVRAEGVFTGEGLDVLVSRKQIGPGFRLIAVFETGGRRVLVDRGFLPERLRALPRPGPSDGAVTVRGNLHWPDEIDRYIPPPDAATGIWFARDLPAMAEALGAEPVLIVLREATPADPVVEPMPLDSSGIPDDHLQYAITWFLLAAVWAGMTGLLLWRIARGKHPRDNHRGSSR